MSRLRFEAQRLRADSTSGRKWNMLFPKGTFHRASWPGGKVVIDDAYVATLARNFKKRGGQRRPIDYFHKGASDVPVPNDEKIASGWIWDVQVRADGLWGLTSFTPKAKASIDADELSCLSPEWDPFAVDVQTGEPQGPTLLGAGLLNDPFFIEMPRVAASASGVPPAQPHTTAVKAKEKKHMEKLLAAALLALNLPATATEEEITATGERLKASAAEREAALKASASITPLKEQVEAEKTARLALAEEVKVLKASAAKAETEAKITEALNGAALVTRITTPKLKASFRSMAQTVGVEAAVEAYGQFPEVVQIGELGHGKGSEEKVTETQESATEKLKASQVELEKKGVAPKDSMAEAMRLNPELGRIAAGLPAVKRTVRG